MGKLQDIAVPVEIALAELSESLDRHQDEIPNADYILTKLALACYKLSRRKETQRTHPQFRAVREDETPLCVVIEVED